MVRRLLLLLSSLIVVTAPAAQAIGVPAGPHPSGSAEPAQQVVTPPAQDGFDFSDAGAGAGIALGAVLLVVSAARARRASAGLPQAAAVATRDDERR
jgi:hypothetical protein